MESAKSRSTAILSTRGRAIKGTVMTGTSSTDFLYRAVEEPPTSAAQLTIILLPDTPPLKLSKPQDRQKGILARLPHPTRRCPS